MIIILTQLILIHVVHVVTVISDHNVQCSQCLKLIQLILVVIGLLPSQQKQIFAESAILKNIGVQVYTHQDVVPNVHSTHLHVHHNTMHSNRCTMIVTQNVHSVML